MRIRVQVVIESDQETTPLHVEEVACFNRGELTPETLGLRLDEAKQILAGVQQAMTCEPSLANSCSPVRVCTPALASSRRNGVGAPW